MFFYVAREDARIEHFPKRVQESGDRDGLCSGEKRGERRAVALIARYADNDIQTFMRNGFDKFGDIQQFIDIMRAVEDDRGAARDDLLPGGKRKVAT